MACARETAQAVIELLRAALPSFAAHVSVAAGAVEMRHGAALAELMGSADLALARAENVGAFAVESASVRQRLWADLASALARALARRARGGRVQLGSFPVVDATGLIHLECPLRLQLEPNGRFGWPRTGCRWPCVAA